VPSFESITKGGEQFTVQYESKGTKRDEPSPLVVWFILFAVVVFVIVALMFGR
jgi:hypothetical protein